MMHRTREGNLIPLKKMETSHIESVINLHYKLSRAGIEVIVDGGGFDLEEIWTVTEVVYGKDALTYLETHLYQEELNRRKKKYTKRNENDD